MTPVNDSGPEHILALLGSVMDGLRRDYLEELRLGADAGSPAAGLRSSQLRLLSMTPTDGLRVTDLAERVGMTKQALGEFANALETLGLLESVRDPADRRVRILRPTARGRECARAGERAIATVEQRWRRRMGAQAWDDLREGLVAARTTAARRQTTGGRASA
jgi:DNA-binding MarR family transcriptional regulator